MVVLPHCVIPFQSTGRTDSHPSGPGRDTQMRWASDTAVSPLTWATASSTVSFPVAGSRATCWPSPPPSRMM